MANTRVLIVDDEEEFAATLAERMRNKGLDAQAVFNGEDAVKRVQEEHFDAIVLDLAMPGMDGLQTLRAMMAVNPDLQVIVLTGHATVAKGVEAVKEGAYEFIEKPAKLDDLMEKIDVGKSRSSALSENRMNEMIDEIMKRRGW